jgi:hypothetical protein
LLDYRVICGIRFTLPFGKAITTPANAAPATHKRSPRLQAADGSERSFSGISLIKPPRDDAPAGNEGVGEHVRTKSHPAEPPVKLRSFGSAPMKKTSFFCRAGFRQSELYRKVRSSRLA